MPTAELIAIGTELLLGEIADTNTQFLARQLRDCGIDLFRSTTVGDNIGRIASAMRESLERADIVITTGGLGPTVDDPTRDAAALAFHIQTEFHPDLWLQIQQRFQKRGLFPTENNKKQAYIPSGAIKIKNPVGTAPAFILESGGKCLICLPGVPSEMETLTKISILPYLTSHFSDLGTIQARVLHTFGLGESAVDELIADLEKLSNPTVGLLAHPGLVDIRITAKSTSSASATEMITEIENEIRKRIPDNIFGINEETLSSSILRLVEERNIPVSIIYSGFSQKPVFSSLKHKNFRIIGRSASPQKPVSFSELKKRVNLTEFSKDILVLCALTRLPDSVKIGIGFYSLGNEKIITSELSISPDLAEEWAKNVCLSALRIQLISSMEK